MAASSDDVVNDPCPVLQSPLPYLLAGLVAMVVLVTIALTILAWPHLRRYYSSSPAAATAAAMEDHYDCAKPPPTMKYDESTTSCERIVVIMAGQSKPTHMATITS
ncbi:hypothetical protein SELMODRAFT_409934 [Selaginella moellendorffii]|uniref:Uncharacterized protein n=1 Tax=Selaginella moellendorffii TaxID=88036 RepID=D8RCX9_SELML|nr:hypothetical protein SELMODRAFT_409934 [Selaginella moellendorffii]